MSKNYSVSHANPRAGKNAMIVGTLEKVLGAGLAAAGVWVFLTSDDQQSKESAKALISFGGISYVVGYITGKFGRLQHWYSNKTYDD